MKVSVIGGGGLVDSCAAFALQTGGLVGEICLIGANKDAAEGQALDPSTGYVLRRPADHAGDMADVADSNDRHYRRLDASRTKAPDLINRNVDLFRHPRSDETAA